MFGIPRRIPLYGLEDLPKLPKPWHREFWDATPDELPFQMTNMDAEGGHAIAETVVHEATPSPSLMEDGKLTLQEPRPLSTASARTSSSDWEWEYYSTSSEEERDEEEGAEEGASVHNLSKAVEEKETDVGEVSETAFVWKGPNEERLSQSLADERLAEVWPSEELDIACESSQPKRDPSEFVSTTEKELRLICWRLKPWKNQRADRLFSSQISHAWGVDCDEVYPSLFIGDAAAAKNVKFLLHVGITHVLNTAEGRDEGLVDLSADHYSDTDIKYKGFLMYVNLILSRLLSSITFL